MHIIRSGTEKMFMREHELSITKLDLPPPLAKHGSVLLTVWAVWEKTPEPTGQWTSNLFYRNFVTFHFELMFFQGQVHYQDIAALHFYC